MLVNSNKWRPAPETKILCNIILEATIKDEDKYQAGLTKIFFRAGMLAALESLRSNRLSELVTLVQKNVKRKLAVQKYQQMKRSAIRIQTWWRGILARRFVLGVRKEATALRLQRAARKFLQRQQFQIIRKSVISIQSRECYCVCWCGIAFVDAAYRGSWCTSPTTCTGREDHHCRNSIAIPYARSVSRLVPNSSNLRPDALSRQRLARRAYRADVHLVVYLQSCIRRRYARRELKVLRTEARSASKFKEISYKLENKVVELTQTLQARTLEKKELLTKLSELGRQLQVWQSKHEEADSRAKQLQVDMQTAHVPKTRFDELLLAKQGLDAQLEESTRRVTAQDEEIKSLTAELERQTQEMEHRQKVAAEEAAAAASKAVENGPAYAALKAELSTLRDQLNRSNALNALTRSARDPTSPGLKSFDTQQGALITPSHSNGSINGRQHLRRHSSAGAYGKDIYTDRDVAAALNEIKRSQNPRAVSVAFNGMDGVPRFRGNGLGNIYDDPVEEKVKLLEDAPRLEEDVLDGLIRGLKIPMPNLTNPPSIKEVLFPANLIALITNEMWKFGLIPESERFLANVMQTIQGHVMVSTRACHLVTIHSPFDLVFYWRGLYHSWRVLAIKCAGAPFLYLHRGKRHAAGDWSWG